MFKELLETIVERTGQLEGDEVVRQIERVTGKGEPTDETPIDVVNAAKRVVPRTAGQARYVKAIRNHDLTFAVGPAGSGKTYLAVALAVEALKQQRMRKIVLATTGSAETNTRRSDDRSQLRRAISSARSLMSPNAKFGAHANVTRSAAITSSQRTGSATIHCVDAWS